MSGKLPGRLSLAAHECAGRSGARQGRYSAPAQTSAPQRCVEARSSDPSSAAAASSAPRDRRDRRRELGAPRAALAKSGRGRPFCIRAIARRASGAARSCGATADGQRTRTSPTRRRPHRQMPPRPTRCDLTGVLRTRHGTAPNSRRIHHGRTAGALTPQRQTRRSTTYTRTSLTGRRTLVTHSIACTPYESGASGSFS